MNQNTDSNFKRNFYIIVVLFVLLFGTSTLVYLKFFTQEAQNRLSRTLQNWTGVNGTLDVYSNGVLVKRFLKIDKLTTGKGTEDGQVRPYLYGWGVLDKNQNHLQDEGEKVVYFQISIHTDHVFYQEGK